MNSHLLKKDPFGLFIVCSKPIRDTGWGLFFFTPALSIIINWKNVNRPGGIWKGQKQQINVQWKKQKYRESRNRGMEIRTTSGRNRRWNKYQIQNVNWKETEKLKYMNFGLTTVQVPTESKYTACLRKWWLLLAFRWQCKGKRLHNWAPGGPYLHSERKRRNPKETKTIMCVHQSQTSKHYISNWFVHRCRKPLLKTCAMVNCKDKLHCEF